MSEKIYEISADDSVMRALDDYASARGMTRSQAFDEIISEKCGRVYTYDPPAAAFADGLAEALAAEGLIPWYPFPGDRGTVSVKSYFGLKYRPVVRYEIALGGSGRHGELRIVIRSSSDGLREGITDFLRLWISAEDSLFSRLGVPAAEYALYGGRIVRGLRITGRTPANAVGDYVKTLDSCMKKYLSGELSADGAAEEYESALLRRGIIL